MGSFCGVLPSKMCNVEHTLMLLHVHKPSGPLPKSAGVHQFVERDPLSPGLKFVNQPGVHLDLVSCRELPSDRLPLLPVVPGGEENGAEPDLETLVEVVFVGLQLLARAVGDYPTFFAVHQSIRVYKSILLKGVPLRPAVNRLKLRPLLRGA